MRVLVVEGHTDMGAYLRQGLREQGYAVDLVGDGPLGLDYASTRVYDLLILDRMLPGCNGLDLLRRLRERGVTTPVIFLTARTSVGEPSGASWERFTEVSRAADGQVLAKARTVWVLLDAATGRPRRVDPRMVASLTGGNGGPSSRSS